MRSVEAGEAWVWCYVDAGVVGEIEGKQFVPYSG
jgi:hypothetical protein